MKKIIKSLGVIAAMSVIVIGATRAYFSDSETSAGNKFEAGSIDLTVDNTCYYNGMACIKYNTSDVYYWDTDNSGTIEDDEKVSENKCVCTWDLDDLTGQLFFDFDDIKPGDWGEDTISLHVTSNDAWSCANITLTENDDVSSVDPEIEAGDTPENTEDGFDGELAQNLHFIWWTDDGDNVLEVGELVVVHDGTPSPATADPVGGVALSDIVGAPTTWTRDLTTADSTWNMFDVAGGPLAPDTTYHIGKAWCFGELTITPMAAGTDYSPTTAGNVVCNGEDVTNASQTDKVEGALSFTAEQYRNNEEYKCPENQD